MDTEEINQQRYDDAQEEGHKYYKLVHLNIVTIKKLKVYSAYNESNKKLEREIAIV